MPKITILLADDNIDFCNILERFLKKQPDFDVLPSVYDGIEASKIIIEKQPDVVILDGTMPKLDGIGVLEKIKPYNTHSACIMLSASSDENIIRRAYALGAKYYIIKPFDLNALADRIRLFGIHTENTFSSATTQEDDFYTLKKFAQNYDNIVVPQNANFAVEERITQVLKEIGIPISLRGFFYLRKAINYAINDFDILNYKTKELYPLVAKDSDTTASSVERSIRHAIEVAWKNRIPQADDIFKDFTMGNNWKPTNGEFIAFIADKLIIEFGLKSIRM